MLRLWKVSESLPFNVPRQEDGSTREVGVPATLLHDLQQESLCVLQHVPHFLLCKASEGQAGGSQ